MWHVGGWFQVAPPPHLPPSRLGNNNKLRKCFRCLFSMKLADYQNIVIWCSYLLSPDSDMLSLGQTRYQLITIVKCWPANPYERQLLKNKIPIYQQLVHISHVRIILFQNLNVPWLSFLPDTVERSPPKCCSFRFLEGCDCFAKGYQTWNDQNNKCIRDGQM